MTPDELNAWYLSSYRAKKRGNWPPKILQPKRKASKRPRVPTEHEIIEVANFIEDRERIRELNHADVRCCSYCGDYAQCRDHPEPVASTGLPRNYKRDTTVPSCIECNLLKSDKMFPNHETRADYLFWRYTQKYAELLNYPDWTDEEVREHGPNLLKFLKGNQYRKEVYERKVENLQLVANGFAAIPIR